MTDTNKPQPFESDAQYLDRAFEYLVAQARRIGAERRLREDADSRPHWDCRTIGQFDRVSQEETRRQVEALSVEERRLREHLEARLMAHRADRARPPLGIDVVVEAAGLGDEERVILLVCAALAISPDIGKAISEGIGVGPFSRFGIEGALILMEADGVGDWLKYRRLFLRSGALVRNGLVTIEYPSITFGPTDVLSAAVEITHKGLALVTGDPTLEAEIQDAQDS